MKRAACLALGILVMSAASAAPSRAQGGGAGNLLVAPTRLVFEGTTRSAAVTLRNTGSRPALYRIELEHARMDEEGRVTRVTEPAPEERPADSLLRHSPRQVLLQPGETQTVRVMVRKPADLAEGEYRSHLAFRAVPSGEPPVAAPASGWSVTLTPIYGVSIPMIVRHGRLDSSVEVADARIVTDAAGRPAAVKVSLRREGSASSYGNIEILARAARGETVTLGRAKGVAVWTPNELRSITVPLEAAAGAPGAPLVVTYTGPDGTELSRRSVDR